MSGDRPTMPPVRLPSDAELARYALAAPLFARAVRLARWAEPGVHVGAGGELLEDGLREAAAHLGFEREAQREDEADGVGETTEAWRLAVDIGLVEVREDKEEEGGEGAVAGTATPGEDASLVTSGGPQDTLDIWLGGLETVLADAAAPDIADLVESITEGGELDLDALDWSPEREADFLDGVLGNLYLLTALEDPSAARPVPLPALAASMIVPDDMNEPTDEVLEEVSEAMMRLDDQFRMLEDVGLVEYQPVDAALIEELDEAEDTAAGGSGDAAGDGRGGLRAVPSVDEGDVARYGMVRLTPLGTYGIRARMLDAGLDAPAVGDLSDADAATLLDRLPGFPEAAAQAEVEQWLHNREAASAARELLAAGRGDDEGAPLRRLGCQQALSLVGTEAEPALREVLDDRHLGGLARVWLAEHEAADVPEPSEGMVFWLTVDTIAAQLGAGGDSAELEGLVQGLVGQHNGFFDAVWRVDHPATAEVLEAMGRLHPDRRAAKEARKAAFKARSRLET